MDFLATRGYSVEASQSDPGEADNTYDWRCEKDILCEDGTLQKVKWLFRWNQVSGSSDNYKLILKNPSTGSDQQLLYFTSQSTSGQSAWDDGLWSFWYSDQDPESYFILSGNKLIGFCPPAGSQFNSGFSTNLFYVQRAIMPLYNDYPAYNLTDQQTIDNTMAAYSLTYATPYSDMAVKMDFLWARYNQGAPMFRIAGGDISALLKFSATSDMIGSANNTLAVVRPIDDKFYISIGYNGRQGMLFDCGTVPPVIF